MYMEEVVLSKEEEEEEEEEEEGINLPPGFRFHPTDEEIVSHYLIPKVMNSNFKAIAVGEANLNKSEPWDLPDKGRSVTGEKENYFFCQRDRKYPTGMRTNRATAEGYWKATGKDKEIYRSRSCNLIGMKKTLVFYRGRAPKGEKTNWVMHEFRLEGKLSYSKGSPKDEWVVCRIFHKNNSGGCNYPGAKKSPIIHPHDLLRMNNNSSFGDDDNAHAHLFDYGSLPPLMDSGPGCSNYVHQDMIINTTTNQQQPLNKSSTYMINMYSGSNQASGSSSLSFMNMHPNSNFGSYPTGCKLEQFSSNTNNQSSIPSLSQDTGLSTEINNNIHEISSKQMINNNVTGVTNSAFEEDLTDLDTFWADDHDVDYN